MQTTIPSSAQRLVLLVQLGCVCVVTFALLASADEKLSLIEALNKDPSLSISNKLLKNYGKELSVLCATAKFGDGMAVILPSDDAWQNLPASTRNELLSDENAPITASALIMSIVKKPAIMEHSVKIINGETIAGDKIRIDPEAGTVCVAATSGAVLQGCAKIWKWDYQIQEGVVIVTSKVLVELPFVHTVSQLMINRDGHQEIHPDIHRVAFQAPIVRASPDVFDHDSGVSDEESTETEETAPPANAYTHLRKSPNPPEQAQTKSLNPPEQAQTKFLNPPEQAQTKSLNPPEQAQTKSLKPPEQAQTHSPNRPTLSEEDLVQEASSTEEKDTDGGEE